MADIFVSYASEDRTRVRPLVEALERQGWKVWWDRNIAAGRQFDEVLEKELEAARAVVAVWTEQSVRSQWVRSEALEAVEREVLVPVRLDDVRLPLPFRRLQTAELLGWPEVEDPEAYAAFIGSVATMVGVAPEVDPAPVLDRPSLVVLPFANLSARAEDEYFADGMTEDLITLLSANYDMFVIARNTSFTYKSRAVDVRDVGRELGVSYVVEGSLRRLGPDTLRITAQLIETANGTHIWAQRYDRPADAVFEVQDELIAEVASATNARVLEREIANAATIDRSSLSQWRWSQRIETEWMMGSRVRTRPDELDATLSEIDAAIEAAPDNVVLVAHKARTLASATSNYTVENRDELTDEACVLARQAMARAPQDPEVVAIAGFAFNLCGRFAEGIPAGERALQRDPPSTRAAAYLAMGLIVSRTDVARGAALLDDVLRRDPFTPMRSACLFWQGLACAATDQVDAAVAKMRESIRIQPLWPTAWVTLALNLVRLGRQDEAADAVAEARRLFPTLTLQTVVGSVRHVGGEELAAAYASALGPLWQ